MKLKSYRRLITQDFEEEDQKLIEQMSSPINNAFNELYFTLNGRTSLRDNLFCTIKEIEIIVDANGKPNVTTSFILDKQGQVIGTDVLDAKNLTNSALFPTGKPFISFIQNGNSVIINNITNLQANNRYFIRVIAFLD